MTKMTSKTNSSDFIMKSNGSSSATLDWNAVEEYKRKLEKEDKEEQRLCSRFCRVVKTKWPHALLLTSVLALVLIVLFKWIALDLIIEEQVKQQVRLEPGTKTWNKWVNISVPIFIKFKFFNITNYNDFENGGRPRLNEVGPYVYEEKRSKQILAVDEEQDTVRYRQHIHYYFRRDMSVGPESDRAILLNIPFVTVAKISRQMTNIPLAHTFTDRALRDSGERLFNRYTVREYLFEGFPVQSYVRFLSNPLLQLVGHMEIPDSFKGSRFGFYKGRNGSDDGEFVVSTGKRVSQDFGRILSWDGKTRLEHWEGNCNLINGTDGSIFHPFIKKTDQLRFYTPELCRSLLLVFKEVVMVKNILAYRFQLPHPKYIFEHKDFCFCPPKTKPCLKQGVFSLSPCKDGAPVSFSAPHFFQSWEPYLKAIDGLHPEAEKHDTYVDIEPTTGLVLRAMKRLQFNIQVEPHPSMQTFRNVRNVLLPFMWVEETAEIPDELAEEIYETLYVPMRMANKACMGGIVGCSILIFVGILGCLFIQIRTRQEKSMGDRADRVSQASSAGVVSVMSSASRSPSMISRSTNTTSSEHKATMTDLAPSLHQDEKKR